MNQVFLYLCTLLSLVITVSGLATVNNLNQLPFHLAFLPVTLFLIHTSIIQLKEPKNPRVLLTHRPILLVVISLVFISLCVFSLRQIQNVSSPTSLPENSGPLIVPAPTTSASPSAELTITAPDTATVVNIRSLPTTTAPIIGKVTPGNTYYFHSFENGWYQIDFTATLSGWVSGSYATPSAANI